MRCPEVKLIFCSLHSLPNMEFSFHHTLHNAPCVRKFVPIQLHCRHLVMCFVILVSTSISTNMAAALLLISQVLQSNLSGSMLMMQTRKEQYCSVFSDKSFNSDREGYAKMEGTGKFKESCGRHLLKGCFLDVIFI